MFSRRLVVILSLVLVAVSLTLLSVNAGDENKAGGDPSDDNACYTGGDWGDGRCVNDWWWNAGWYRQAAEEGRINPNDVPDQYKGGVQDLVHTSSGPVPATTDEP